MVTLDARDLGTVPGDSSIRRYTPDDLVWASELLDRSGGRLRVRRGDLVDAAVLPGLVCTERGRPVGLTTFRRRHEELEITVVAAEPLDEPTRARLLAAAVDEAGPTCRRVVAICSNADLAAQRSLQVNGFRLCAVRPGAIEDVRRRLTPGRMATSLDGVEIRDEIEFELLVG